MEHGMQCTIGLGAMDKWWDRVRGVAAAQGVGRLTVQWPALVQKSGAGAESGRQCTPNEAIQKEQAGELRNPHPGVLRRGRNRPAAEPCRRSSSTVTGRLPAVHRPLSGLCRRWRGAVRHDRRQPADVRELPGPPGPGCGGRRALRRPSPWLISVGRERGWRARRCSCLGKHDRDSNAAQPGKSSIHLL